MTDTLATEERNEPVCGGVTPRVVLLALALAVGFGYAVPIIDFKFNNSYPGASQLPAGAIAVVLFLIAVANPLLQRFGGRFRFSRNEILTVYITCLFTPMVSGFGAENFFVPNVIASFYFATRENKWLQFLQPYLKPWFTPALDSHGRYNEQLVSGWYLGTKGVVPWGAWLVPILAWLSIIIALYIMLACLAVMLRAQWSDREALAFPLLRLPLEMTESDEKGARWAGRPGFFRNPLTWVGIGVGVFIQFLNGLNFYVPQVPTIQLTLPSGPFFSEAPWNQMGVFTLTVWPMVVGITYLLTAEISFSLWFFYLFSKFEMIMAYYLGFPRASMPEATFTRGYAKNFVFFQQIGAYLAYVAIILWIGREHYGHIVRRALRRTPAREAEKGEPLSYPVAFWGFALSSLFILAWTHAAGVRLDVALVLWIGYLVIVIALTRVVVEGGLLFIESGWAPLGPVAHLTGAGPGHWLNPASGVPAAFIGGALMSQIRSCLLPSYIQSFKIAHDRKIRMKPLLGLIFGCTVISLAISIVMILKLGYGNGGLSLMKWWAWGNGAQGPAGNAHEIVKGVEDNLWSNWCWLLIGALATWGMMFARTRFLWFPLHPIGYLMCAPYAGYTLWFSIFLGWVIKSLITRYGGVDNYRKCIPLFLGLVLGDIGMMIFWVAIDGWQGRIGHNLIPGN